MKIEQLPWLERLPANKAIELTASFNENIIKTIKHYYLSERQLTSIGKLLSAHATDVKHNQIKPFNIGLAGSYNIDLLNYPLITSGLRYGYLFNVTLAPFNSIAQVALNPDSEFNSNDLDAILIMIDHTLLEGGIEEGITYVKNIIQGFNQKRAVPCIIQSLPNTYYLNSALIDKFNSKLSDELENTPHTILDLASLANMIGLENWHNPTQYHLAKLGFSQSLVPLVADKIAKCIAKHNGYQKKCIVLDLDNTLWGGIVGDLGTHGIIIGQGHPLGEAFAEFQKMLLTLKHQGFILAVCSKNDEIHAKDPFVNRTDMILKLDDFVSFKANWLPKSHNIQSIANELSIGLDSIIFIDDNVVEREEVRLALPDVTIPALGNDPSFYTHILLNSGYFETHQLTAEDRDRTQLYHENAKRENYKQTFTDLNSFYTSLEMNLNIFKITNENKDRVLQLINKTNQFNLSQERMTQTEFMDWQNTKNHFGFCFELIDKFGSNGIIGVVLLESKNQSYSIENFILSCRVINRQVEHAIINYLVKLARTKVKSLVGKFIPGIRNELVQNLYANLGFSCKAKSETGSSIWELDISGFSELPNSIKVSSEPIPTLEEVC